MKIAPHFRTSLMLVVAFCAIAYIHAAEPPGVKSGDAWKNTGLSVTIDVPEERSAYCDDTGEILLGIKAADIDPSLHKEGVDYLRHVESSDKRLMRFVQGQGYYPLNKKGPTIIAPLLPFSNLVLYARGALPGMVAWRTNSISPGKLTDIHFTAAELYPMASPAVTMKSRLVVEETDIPVAQADIRVSGYCFKAKTVTDNDGFFALESVPADRLLTFEIAGADSMKPQRYAFSVRRVLWPRSESDLRDINWRIPASRELVVKLDGLKISKAKGYPVFGIDALRTNGTWRFRKVLGVRSESNEIGLVQSRPGTLRARIHEGLFLVRYSAPVEFGVNDFSKETTIAPSPPIREKAEFQVLDHANRPVPGAQVSFFSLIAGEDPLDLSTDKKGVVFIGPLNVDSLVVIVDSTAGFFSGNVTIPPGDKPAVIRLTPLQTNER